MKLKKLIAAASALTLLGSLAAAVPASAATEERTVTLPDEATRYIVQRSTNGGNSYSATNGARAVTNKNGTTFTFGVKVHDNQNGTDNLYRVISASKDITALSDGNDGTGITLGNTNSIYIPFDEPVAVTKVEVKSSSNPYIVALVENGDITDKNVNVANETDAVLPIASSDNWYRINSSSYQKIDDNYTLTRTAGNTSSSIELKDDGTAVEYAGIFIDNNNHADNSSVINEITVTYEVEVEDPEPEAPTVSIVDSSRVTENGTGEYAGEVATGFIAKVEAFGTAPKKMGVTVNDVAREEQDMPTVVTEGAAYFKVIVTNADAEDVINVYVD